MAKSNFNKAQPRHKFTEPEGKSKGILDDYAVRGDVATKEGSIEHTPTADNHITNKKYVDDQFPVTHASTTGQTATDHHDNSNDHAPGSDNQVAGDFAHNSLAGLNDGTSYEHITQTQKDALHAQSHSVASHSDTSATGTELNTLTDGSDADSLHLHDSKPSKTTAAWSKTIGAGGDYADWATMMAAMPDMIAHAVTATIKAGTTLTEICNIRNKHGLTVDAAITIQAEKYFPTSGVIPTADSATATTLRDAALATAALGDDYFNGCWVFVCDGTGTDNGFVPITDYVDVTGDVTVASWPGTQPDNTSRYLIVGALVDGESARNKCVIMENNTTTITWLGIGYKGTTQNGFYSRYNTRPVIKYCGAYGTPLAGFYLKCVNGAINFSYNGVVGCNTNNHVDYGGVLLEAVGYGYIAYNSLSDNVRRGFLLSGGGYSKMSGNFGDLNGTWGTYAVKSGQAYCTGTECSGTSGNHSNGAGDGSLAY